MTDRDTDTLARTLYGEARGEGEEGMSAVACVVMNRVALASEHPHFGDGTVAGACRAPWQFSSWNANDPNLPKLLSVTEDDPAFAAACRIAAAAVSGSLTDITSGATYYYASGSPLPKWAFGKDPCASIGHHLFFTDIS